MAWVEVLEQFVESPATTTEDIDDVLIALLQKHALTEDKWVQVSEELTGYVAEPKSKQWCKNRAKKDACKMKLEAWQAQEVATTVARPGLCPDKEIQASKGSVSGVGPACFQQIPIEGKGLGIVATRDLKCGDMIIEEVPLLQYDKDHEMLMEILTRSSSIPEFVKPQWARLSEKQREQVMELHDQCSEKTLSGIMRTNALARGVEGTGSLICPVISRFNHSCAPNCQHAWDEAAGLERVFACRDIEVGEELCICYIDIVKPRDERQRELSVRYGFTCACTACSDANRLSDRRRAKIAELDSKVMQVGGVNQKQALGMVQDILDKYDEEGIHNLSLRARACYDAFQLALALRDLRGAKKWIGMAHQYYSLGEGPENPSTLRMLAFVKDPKSHRNWR